MRKVVECGAGCMEIQDTVRLEQGQQPQRTNKWRERRIHKMQRNFNKIAQDLSVLLFFLLPSMPFRYTERHLPVKEQDTVPMDNVLGDLPVAEENCRLCIFQEPEFNM